MKNTVKIYLLLALLIPLTISVPWGRLQINVPAEPIIVVLAIVIFIPVKFRDLFSHPFVKHPVTICYLFYFGWMFITTCTSSSFVVSAKYLLVSFAHWWVFYLGFYFTGLTSKLSTWYRYYSYGLIPVIIIIWVRFAYYHFNPATAVILAKPFYDDHTILGACLALLFPIALFHSWRQKDHQKKSFLLSGIISLVIAVTLYITFSRAAWLSLILSLTMAAGIIWWKLGYWVTVSGFITFFGLLVLVTGINQPRLSTANEITNKESVANKIRSIADFTHNVSNLERLNRYKCAWRMFLDRPLTGFGPGTYPDRYLSYQRPEDMTRLSVTTPTGPDGKPHPQGRGGSTHSEYLQNLSEMGLPGFLLWMVMVLVSIYTGFRAYNRAEQTNKGLIIMLLCSLVAYFIHLLFNNFMHSEKANALFMPLLATLVSLDKKD